MNLNFVIGAYKFFKHNDNIIISRHRRSSSDWSRNKAK